MSCSLVLRRLAQREFDEAADWYDAQRPGLGTEFIEEVNRVFQNLRGSPGGHVWISLRGATSESIFHCTFEVNGRKAQERLEKRRLV